jgi:iron complex transport system permease protein
MSPARLALLLGLALVPAMLLSLLAGPVRLAPSELLGGGEASIILLELRAPRTLLAALLGAGLGLAGAVLQGWLRNPLADPGIFGISASAALGAVTALFLGLGSALALPALALAGAAAGTALLALAAGRTGSLLLFALAGLLLSSLAGALTALLISLAPSPFVTAQIVTWLMGALTDRSWADVRIAAPLILAGAALLATTARPLDALALGETTARSLGADLAQLQRRVILGMGLVVGGAVAVAGIIGFVGLIVPHLVRPLVGHRPGALLLPSALAGALLLLVADSLVRLAPTTSELRLGIALSLVGAPFFLWLLWRLRRSLA